MFGIKGRVWRPRKIDYPFTYLFSKKEEREKEEDGENYNLMKNKNPKKKHREDRQIQTTLLSDKGRRGRWSRKGSGGVKVSSHSPSFMYFRRLSLSALSCS